MSKILSRNALIGTGILFLDFLLAYAFADKIEYYIGGWIYFLFLFFAILGMYLLFPYLNYISDPDKPWNKK